MGSVGTVVDSVRKGEVRVMKGRKGWVGVALSLGALLAVGLWNVPPRAEAQDKAPANSIHHERSQS